MMEMSRKMVRAKKSHRCQLCGRFIRKGEIYEKSNYIGDDGPYTFKCHAICADVSQKIWKLAQPEEYGMDMDCFLDGVREAIAIAAHQPRCSHGRYREDCRGRCPMAGCISWLHSMFGTHRLVRNKMGLWEMEMIGND